MRTKAETPLQHLLIVFGDAEHVEQVGVPVQIQHGLSSVRETVSFTKAKAIRAVLIEQQLGQALAVARKSREKSFREYYYVGARIQVTPLAPVGQ